MNRDRQIGATYAMKLAAIGRFGRRVLAWYRFFTPHYWRMRARRDDVAHAMQALLPVPYDPCAIELRCRSFSQAAVPGDGSWEDASWKTVLEKLSAKALDRRLASVGAVEIGAWAVEDVHSAFAAMDQDFIAGVALRTGKAIESFSDLSEKFAPKTIAGRVQEIVFGPSTGMISDHQGGVGEAVLFRHLQDARVDVELAPHPNTPGWDMLIEGHPVNVKTVMDAADLSKHFARYPNIPAVVPGDAASVSENALHFDSSTGEGMDAVREGLDSGGVGMVVSDHALSVEAIHAQVEQADTLITGGHDTFEGHLPFVTMALSGFREFDLLLTGKTDFATAAKNAALDATGTGVGGAVGAKTGAGIGTLIWPGVGTVIGGIAGGIIGAITGREITGEIKQRPYKEAVASYESALSQFQSQARAYEAKASVEFNNARLEQEFQLKKRGWEARRRVKETKDALDSWIIYDSCLQPNEACALIGQSSNELAQLRAAIQRRYQSISWWRKVLWPDVGTLAQQQALLFLRRIQRKLGELHRDAKNGQAVNRGQLMALLGAAGVMQEQTVAALEKIYATQRERDGQARNLLGEALSAILGEREDAEAQLSKKLEALREAIREAMRPALKNLNNRVECARLEGAKLGLSL